MRVALYARVSTQDQTCENQLLELRQYAAARGWTVTREYVDTGVSGAKERRPALDDLLVDARRRRLDTVLVWRLDRLGRNLRHLVLTIEEFSTLGVAFTSLGEGIDTTTPAGRLQLHVIAAIAEFERARITERIHAGLQRARRQGRRLGRRPRHISQAALASVAGLSVRKAAQALGVPPTVVHRARVFRKPSGSEATFA